MYLLKFNHDDKSYFLHSGTQFIGAMNEEDAHNVCIENTAKGLSVGGFDIVQTNEQELLRMIGGAIPYKIIDFHGGLLPLMGVEIVN
jgi:hypothetical protein